MPRVLVAIVALTGLLLAPARASAQPTQRLHSLTTSGSITANGGSVELLNTGGLGSLRVQSTGTYSGTWEIQCSAAPAGATPVYDTDDEVNLSLEGASASAVQSVTDAAAIYSASIAGCTAIKAIATAWTSGTLTVYLSATTTGGSAGGGGGTSSSVEVAEGGTTAQVTATSGGSLQVECTSGCGAGASIADDADFTDGTTAGTPVGGVAEQAAPSTVTEGDFGWVAITLNRALKSALFAPDGTSLVGTAGTAATPVLTVQGIASMTPFLANPGTAANWGVYVEDAAETAGGNLAMAGTVRRDTAATSAGTAGDNATLNTDALGRLWTTGSAVEDAAETAGGILNMAGAVRRDTAASSGGTDGDNVTLNTNSEGRLWVNAAPPTPAATVYNPVRITDGSNFISPATDVTEDAGETAGGTGPMVLSVRRDVAASSAGTTGDNATFNTDATGQLWTRQLDPCSGVAKSYLPIDIVTATTTEITSALAGASTHYYICSVALVTAGANNVAIVDDDTDNCASVTSGVMGGVTAGEGFNLAANGGLTLGNGQGSIARTGGTNRVLCIVTSAAVQLSGTIVVVAAP